MMLERLRERLVPATTRARITALAAVAVVIALVSAGLVLTSGPPGKQITAYFTQAIGVYPGSTVRILGIDVGTIDSVQPEGKQVKVTMTVNGGIPVAAGADAAVVSASVIADRYVQLFPPYTSGPQMASGAVIPVSRTAVPVEVDELYDSLEKLSNDLGPNGVNKNGALSDLINTGAANLAGNGADFNQMITDLGQATRTLSGSRDNFFATVNNLEQFTAMLNQENSQVQLAQQQLADVFGFLSGDRTELSGALNELSTALGQVKYFIADNRGLITSNVTKLASITKILVTERASLAQAMDELPVDVDNVVGAYDPKTHTLESRGNLRELEPPGSFGASTAGTATDDNEFCQATDSGSNGSGNSSGSNPLGALCSQEEQSAARDAELYPVSAQEQAALPPLPLPAVGTVYGSRVTVKEKGR
jgi:phospholipid/cholesterol/gamma-HCH transport system substrate-binding protein